MTNKQTKAMREGSEMNTTVPVMGQKGKTSASSMHPT